MNVLIFGANGLLGSVLVEKLNKTHKVYAVSRDENDFLSNKNTNIINMDLTNVKLDKLPDKIDAIYYLAQSNEFRNFPSGSCDMLNINIKAPLEIINWAKIKNVKTFVYASTGGIYQKSTYPLSEENTKFDYNQSFYVDSKITAENLLGNFSSFFKTFIIIRPFFIYGKKQNKSMLIPRLIDNIKHDNEIMLDGKNGIKINPIYVEDAAIATAKALDLEGEFKINIAGKEIYSIRDISIIIGNILNKTPILKSTNKQLAKNLIASIDLMEKILYIPKIDIKNGILKMLNKE